MTMFDSVHRYAKIYIYSVLGAAVIGVGASLSLELNRSMILPFFPDVLDSVLIVCVGGVLLYEVFREALGHRTP
jgi:hypothetical protein